MFDVLHTVINSVYVQNLPTEQAASVVTDFSWGYDPYTHACKARPPTTVGRTSLSVIIIIIIQLVLDHFIVRDNCKLDCFGASWLPWVPCPRFLRELLSDQFLHRVHPFSICQVLSSTWLQDVIPLLLSQLASVLLQHVLVATTSSSVRDECSCQLLFMMQLPSRLQSLYAVKDVASGSSRQTGFADPIESILPS